MALSELQQVLARIYTDAALRAEFLADPAATARRLNVELLAKLDPDAVQHFAAILLHRRRLPARRRIAPAVMTQPRMRVRLALQLGRLRRVFGI